MGLDLFDIIFYRIAANIITPLILSTCFLLVWHFVFKKKITEKLIYKSNLVIPIISAVYSIFLLFKNATESSIGLTFVIAIGLMIISVPIALFIAWMNTNIITNVMKLPSKKNTHRGKVFLYALSLIVLIIFYPKSQEETRMTKNERDQDVEVYTSCFCAGFSSSTLVPEDPHQYCFGLVYQCRVDEEMKSPIED